MYAIYNYTEQLQKRSPACYKAGDLSSVLSGFFHQPVAHMVRALTHPNSAIHVYALNQALQVPARYPGRHQPLFAVTNPQSEIRVDGELFCKDGEFVV